MSVPTPQPTPSNRRNVELTLLGFSAAVTVAALIIVELSQDRFLDANLAMFVVAYVVVFLGAHLAVRRFAPYADPLILPIVALLNGIGLVLIYRLDLASAAEGEASSAATAQVRWMVLGVIGFVAVLILIRNYRVLARYGYTIGLAGIVFLAIPAVLPASLSETNGAKIWIRLPGFNIQPGEFSKIALIIFFAAILVAKRDLFTTAGKHFLGMDFPRPRDLGPVVAAWMMSIMIMVFEKDLGTSLLIFSTILVMLYIATERVGWLVIGAVMLVFGYLVANMVFSHVQVRTQTWLDPFSTYDTTGFQISQSLFGLATGGIGGTGLGSGRPNEVPFANTDFIIATIGEELGLIGLIAILVLFLVIVIRGLRTALSVRDSFGKLLAAGLSVTMAVQLFVVVGGVTKLIPLTGLTTPFMSYGGSSLLANYILIALLMVISNDAREPAPTTRPAPKPAIAEAMTEELRRP
ncbi:MAG: FtsW/RodA/SpoVE family cell cycle protein [Nocardiaceae bacterium]|nr:FtsW/RodA/SpoVE family cell cycle protein [Nocardiaceae bacterium]